MENTFIKAASVIVLKQSMEALKKIAKEHGKQYDDEYNDNMLMMSVIGYAIATGRDKGYILDMFAEIVDEQQWENGELLIDNAKDLL